MTKNPKEHRKDPHYKQAKRENYRARSAYKLLDINKRFNVFKRAFYILDIGATPGSWLQVARKFAEENISLYKDGFYHRDNFKIMGVDLKSVTPVEDVKIIKMDVRNPAFLEEVRSFFGGKIDLLLSDASIKKSGIKFQDDVNQIKLCNKILEIGNEIIRNKGAMVIKVFQGSDFDEFYASMKNKFRLMKSYKPKGSRKNSNEIYLIGMKKI
ncbi:MAG: RlmE family RNA methyltransferase [Candidatus Lokiarchaeota archaeon]|nr:RlmE family RNA methyltransferase [Candidatus Lokiarchaeota archaeon]